MINDYNKGNKLPCNINIIYVETKIIKIWKNFDMLKDYNKTNKSPCKINVDIKITKIWKKSKITIALYFSVLKNFFIQRTLVSQLSIFSFHDVAGFNQHSKIWFG